jgi:ankyrin repeat protein
MMNPLCTFEMIKLMVNYKVDHKIDNLFGQNALTISSFNLTNHSFDIFCFFLDNLGHDPNFNQNLLGESCVHILCFLGEKKFLKKLIENKADFDLLHLYNNKTPKNILKERHPNIIKELFK